MSRGTTGGWEAKYETQIEIERQRFKSQREKKSDGNTVDQGVRI